MKDIRNHNEKVRREGVTLAKTVLAADPGARNTVKDDGGVTSLKNIEHPGAPSLVETASAENRDKAEPVDRVEGLTEIDLEDKRG